MEALIGLIISGIVVMISAYIVPGVIVPSFVSALAVAVILGLLNMFVKPILLLLTLPINILTLGLFTVVINVLMIYLASAIVPGFKVDNFLSALLFGLLVGLIGGILQVGK